MYYLYKKTRNLTLPKFAYSFKNFTEFYEVAPILEVPLIDTYNVRVKSDDYKEIVKFIDIASNYGLLQVYIEVSESLLEYIQLAKPRASLISEATAYDIYKELVGKYGILFEHKCLDVLYYAIDHTYEDMEDAMLLIKQTYGNTLITREKIERLFLVDDKVYPRSVLIGYLRFDRGFESRLDRCLNQFGNDIVYYSMRKTARKLLEDKINYMKTGKGSYLIKTIPTNNLINMVRCLDYENNKFKDVRTILHLYQRGESIYDFVQ